MDVWVLIAQVVQAGMLMVLGATAKVVYSTSINLARVSAQLEAHEKRVDRIEERVDDLAS